MFTKQYMNREGMPVYALRDEWVCHGCSAEGNGKRNDVRLAAKTHAAQCREINWEEAERRYRKLLYRNNMSLAQLKSAASQVKGNLKINGDLAGLVFKTPGPGGPRCGTVCMNFSRGRNGTWSIVR